MDRPSAAAASGGDDSLNRSLAPWFLFDPCPICSNYDMGASIRKLLWWSVLVCLSLAGD
jgi:hypothetical protein